jgi:hypothetical protein
MNSTQEILLKFLKEDEVQGEYSPKQLSHLYTNSALLGTLLSFVEEQVWLQKNENVDKEISYADLLIPLLESELSAISFYQDYLIESGCEKNKTIIKKLKNIEKTAIELIAKYHQDDQRIFVTESLTNIMKNLLECGDGLAGSHLYRAFDRLDDIFVLDYQQDRKMNVDYNTNERLFQGAGIGVQSSYSTILLALHRLAPKQGCRIIDLGSGYGRVGLACSAMRPDIIFTGYEYVPHRVELSNNASLAMGLENNLKFVTQDLSLESFIIPEADIYYFYDPFSKETYKHVLKQIVEISKRRKIQIVAKGDAKIWIKDIANENCWPRPELIDDGHLSVFRSF